MSSGTVQPYDLGKTIVSDELVFPTTGVWSRMRFNHWMDCFEVLSNTTDQADLRADRFLCGYHTDSPYLDESRIADLTDGGDCTLHTHSGAPPAHKDSHDPEDGSDALDTAAPAELASVQAAGVGSSHSFARADHVHQIQHSIADNHLVTIDGTTNQPVDNDFAKFTTSGLEGRSYAEVRSDINVADGADVTGDNPPQAHATSHTDGSDDIQDATAAQKGLATATQITKLDGIEAGADVTNTVNVTAAGAVMDSEVDADIKTLSLPANTTISAFGATLVDDADAATARTTLGLEIGTDVLAQQTIGIADDNLLEVDGSPNSGEYCKFTANGVEGRTKNEQLSDLALGVDHQNVNIWPTHIMPGSPDVCDEPFTYADTTALTAGGWADADNAGAGAAASTQDNTTVGGESSGKLKLDVTSAGAGAYAQRVRDVGTLGTSYSIEFRIYFDGIGALGDNDHFLLWADNGSYSLVLRLDSSDVYVYSGSENVCIATGVVEDTTWMTWKVSVIDDIQVIVEKKNTGGNWELIGVANCAWNYSATDGNIVLSQYGYTNTTTAYVDYIEIDNGAPDAVITSYDILKVDGYNCTAGSHTIDFSTPTQGANGIQSASVVADAWYAIYVIYDPTNDVAAGFAQNRESASIDLGTPRTAEPPSLPGDYTQWRHIGWARTDGSGNISMRPAVCNLFDEVHDIGLLSSGYDYDETDLTDDDAAWHSLSLIDLLPPGVLGFNCYLRINYQTVPSVFKISKYNSGNAVVAANAQVANNSFYTCGYCQVTDNRNIYYNAYALLGDDSYSFVIINYDMRR